MQIGDSIVLNLQKQMCVSLCIYLIIFFSRIKMYMNV